MSKDNMSKDNVDKKIRGEGDSQADRNYREKTREFVESGKVDEAARKAREEHSKEDEKAEEEGKSHARELDPEVHREYDKPVDDDAGKA